MMIWTFRIRRSWQRFILWSVTLAITFVVLLVAWVNWRGARDWEQAKARLLAAGEDKTFDQYVPTLPPDEVNFFAIPALRELCVVEKNDPSAGTPAMVRQRCKELDVYHRTVPGASTPIPDDFFYNGDMSSICTYLYEERGLKRPASTGNGAKDVLIALDETRPLMREMLASVNRPEAQFIFPWKGTRLRLDDTSTFGRENHGIISARSAFSLRTRAAKEAGDLTQAVDCVRVIVRMADAFSKEPSAVGSLVAGVIAIEYGDATMGLLATHRLNDEQLAILQSEIGRIHPYEVAARGVHPELAMELELLELLENAPCWRRGYEWSKLMHLSGKENKGWRTEMAQQARNGAMSPAGVWSGAKAVIGNAFLDDIITPMRSQGIECLPAMEIALRKRMTTMSDLDMRKEVASRVLTYMNSVLRDIGISELSQRQLLLAIALERFHAAHAEYPQNLNLLVPQFLSEVPRDLYAKGPIHYERIDADHFIVRSVGPDGKLGTEDDLVLPRP